MSVNVTKGVASRCCENAQDESVLSCQGSTQPPPRPPGEAPRAGLALTGMGLAGQVYGLDPSAALVSAAQDMKRFGQRAYKVTPREGVDWDMGSVSQRGGLTQQGWAERGGRHEETRLCG